MFCLFVFVFAWSTWVYYANKELLLFIFCRLLQFSLGYVLFVYSIVVCRLCNNLPFWNFEISFFGPGCCVSIIGIFINGGMFTNRYLAANRKRANHSLVKIRQSSRHTFCFSREEIITSYHFYSYHYILKFPKYTKLAGLWFSPGTTVSPTNKTGLRDISELLLKVGLNTISTIVSSVFVLLSIFRYSD
jgi:hypothetical protein